MHLFNVLFWDYVFTAAAATAHLSATEAKTWYCESAERAAGRKDTSSTG